MLFAVLSIGAAAALLLGVRHEPAVRAWALSPRTPQRVAHNIIGGVGAAAGAISIAGILGVAIVGAIDQAAGVL